MKGIKRKRGIHAFKKYSQYFTVKRIFKSLNWDDYDVSKIRAEIAIAYAFAYLVLLVGMWAYKATSGLPKAVNDVFSASGTDGDNWILFGVIVVSNIRVACGSLYGLSPEFESDYLASTIGKSHPIRLFRLYAFLKAMMLLTILRSFFSSDNNQQLLLTTLFFIESSSIVGFDILRHKAFFRRGMRTEAFIGNAAIVLCDFWLFLISAVLLTNEANNVLTSQNIKYAGWIISKFSLPIFFIFILELIVVYRLSIIRGLCIWYKILSFKESNEKSQESV
jgi:hypothetical protein